MNILARIIAWLCTLAALAYINHADKHLEQPIVFVIAILLAIGTGAWMQGKARK